MSKIWFSGPRKSGRVLKPSSLLSLRSTVSYLLPLLCSVLHEAIAVSPPLETNITAGMLLKDAAYTAAGHVYYELSNYLSFNEWFHRSLSTAISNHHPNMRIIHRKLALLLGQWISEIKGDTRKLVYHALVGLLQDNDIAIRLLGYVPHYLFQDSSFSELDLFECLPTCWTVSFKLIEDVQEFDSKVQVLNFISVLEHAGDKVNPFASQLSHFFQKATIKIIEDYIIFGGQEFLKSHGASLAKIVDTIVGNVNDKGLLTALPIIDLLVQELNLVRLRVWMFPWTTQVFFYSNLDTFMLFPLEAPPLISSALQKLIFILLSQDDGQNPSRTTVRVSSGAILARLLVMNTNFSAQLLSEPSLSTSIQQAGISVNNNLLLSLVDMWIDKVDDANVVQQKEYAMALFCDFDITSTSDHQQT